jgi:hypothetical protein
MVKEKGFLLLIIYISFFKLRDRKGIKPEAFAAKFLKK